MLPHIDLYPFSSAREVDERIQGCEILLLNKVRLGREQMAAAPALRLVVLAATGTDNVDLEAARELGITVCNIRDYATPSVVQHVFGLVLALTLRLQEYRDFLLQGEWERSPHFCLLNFPSRELSGRTLGIVGLGRLGRAVSLVGQALGMRVVAARRSGIEHAESPPGVERLPLNALLQVSDVVSLHCPLTPATKHLLNPDTLGLLPPGGIVINTARGDLVNLDALLQALLSGRLGGAGIDVLPEEPPTKSHPLLTVRLPNLIVTPHIAWAAQESRQRALDRVVFAVQEFLAHRPCHRVA